MDQTLRLCSQIQQTIADVDLLSEVTESDHDKIDLLIDASSGESAKTHSGVGSPESIIDDMDDRTFRAQVDKLLREARDYINDDENNTADNDVDIMVQESVGISSQPSIQGSVDFSRQPSMSISLVHHEHDNLEMKGTSSCGAEGNTHSDSEEGYESPSSIPSYELRRQNLCNLEEMGFENLRRKQDQGNGKQRRPSLTSRQLEITKSTSMSNDWTEGDQESKWARLIAENADLKKEREDLTTRCANLEKEMAKAQTAVLKERAELKRSVAECAKEKVEMTKMKAQL